jgi:hypothetical protein
VRQSHISNLGIQTQCINNIHKLNL